MTRGAAAEAAVALFLGLLLVTLGAAVTEPGSAQPDLRPSTYVNDPTGLRALHEVLLASGARPERFVEEPGKLGDTDATLVVVGPTEPFTDADLEALYDWVEMGGRLVVSAALEAPTLRASFHEGVIEPLGVHARSRRLPPQPTYGVARCQTSRLQNDNFTVDL